MVAMAQPIQSRVLRLLMRVVVEEETTKQVVSLEQAELVAAEMVVIVELVQPQAQMVWVGVLVVLGILVRNKKGEMVLL